MRKCQCPYCSILLYYPNNNPPSAGNSCICFNCGHVLIFNPDLTVRAMTDVDRFRMSKEEMMQLSYASKIWKINHNR